MATYIPIVSQEIEEPTMVVRPSVPPAPPAPKTPKSALKQPSLTGKTVRFAAPLTQVRTYQRANGTRVRSHTRVIKSNKSSKSAKASKPHRNTKNVASKPARGPFPPKSAFAGMDDETAKLIKSMMIQCKLDLVRGNK